MKKYLLILDDLTRKILAFWDSYMAKYGKSVKDGYISNAFAPLVWLIVFLFIPFIIVILFSDNDVIVYISIAILGLVILFALVMYVVLLFKDPKLLQSEWYRLEDKRLDLMAQQGEETPKLPDSLVTITDTEMLGGVENE